jgi:hypothetical protein
MAFLVLFMNKKPYRQKQRQKLGNGYWTPEKQKGEEVEMNFLKSKSEYEILQFSYWNRRD